jgi:hypothetical protein
MYLADDNVGEEAESRKAKDKASLWLARNYVPFDGMSVHNLNLVARLGKLSGNNRIGTTIGMLTASYGCSNTRTGTVASQARAPLIIRRRSQPLTPFFS